MARGRSHRSKSHPTFRAPRTGRVAVANAKRSLPRFSVAPLDLRLFEDRRYFDPSPVPPARAFFRAASRLVLVDRPPSPNVNVSRPGRPYFNQSGRMQTKAAVAFAAPDSVLVCVRRKRRKEVLHAKGVAGRRGLRPPRRSDFSDVRC